MYTGTLNKIKSDKIYSFCETVIDTYLDTGDESYLHYLIENVKAAPIIMGRRKEKDFDSDSLLKYPATMTSKDNKDLRHLMGQGNLSFLASGDKFEDRANQLVKFTYNGKNYIGYTGDIGWLLNAHTNANEVNHYKTDHVGRNQVGFVGYTYEGDTPPKVSRQALANMYVNQVKEIYDRTSDLSDEEKHTRFYNMKEHDLLDTSQVKDLGDITDKYDSNAKKVKGSLGYKPKSETTSDHSNDKTESLSVNTNTNPKKMAEEIYKEHSGDKNFIAKKITALRGLINKYKFTMNNTHDSKIKSICKTVINKIIEVIDRLLGFIHKGVNRF